MKPAYIYWEGRSYNVKDVPIDVNIALKLVRGEGFAGQVRNIGDIAGAVEPGERYKGPIFMAGYDVGVVFFGDQTTDASGIPNAPPATELDDTDEFERENAFCISGGDVSECSLDLDEETIDGATEFPNNVDVKTVIEEMISFSWVERADLETGPSESIIHELASRTPLDSRLILEDIESDLRVFVNMNVTKLRVKEQAFEVGQTRWDDPGDYPSAMGSRPLPSHEYVEEIYGAAELAFDIPIENIPPNIHWRIEHTEAKVRQYKMEGQHVQQISSTSSSKALGMLIFSDDQGGEAQADVGLLSDALDEELYRVKQDLDELMLPPEFNQSYTLQIKWAHWEQIEGKLTCTLSVTAELD